VEVCHTHAQTGGLMTTARLGISGLAPMAALAVIGLALLVYFRPWSATSEPVTPTKSESRVSERQGGILKLKSPLLAESYGIKAEPAREVTWHPKLFVDGRVVDNPQALVDVRAPFAGVITVPADGATFRLGAAVQARQVLALVAARFNQVEKLDLESKRMEAEIRHHGAEEILKLRQERLERLGRITGSVSRGELDTALIQLSEARMLKDIAMTHWELWKHALVPGANQSITVPMQAPFTGEIVAVGAYPGTNVEAGQMLARIADFSQVLLRLDFPVTPAAAGPPAVIEVETLAVPLAAPSRWRARLRGPVANVDIGLQKAGYLYEIVPGDKSMAPTWRPGLFVKASVPDPAKTAQPAVAIPASALLVHQGRTLVYVELNVGRYERREVFVLDRAGDTFYVSPSGWTSTSDAVVTSHAQVLLSEEFRSDVDDD
jgi:hypothetical protein